MCFWPPPEQPELEKAGGALIAGLRVGTFRARQSQLGDYLKGAQNQSPARRPRTRGAGRFRNQVELLSDARCYSLVTEASTCRRLAQCPRGRWSLRRLP